jgi:late competence protein required for DNA uptake (superfamily II DNA/RNA helicase)
LDLCLHVIYSLFEPPSMCQRDALASSVQFSDQVHCLLVQVTLAAFRSGKFHTLVATDVAARGLDINDVQVVIQVLGHLHREDESESLQM